MKLVSLNIELDRYLKQVGDWALQEQPDVACLQEVFEQDFPKIESALGMQGVFAPMAVYAMEPEQGEQVVGVAMLSLLPLKNVRKTYYVGDEQLARQVRVRGRQDAQKYCRALLQGNVEQDGQEFHIATTHFTWSPDGQADDTQRVHLGMLLDVLGGVSELVLCGDFNAPRGGEIFSVLASKYKDNIPERYATSIDYNLHRDAEMMRGRSLMVDGLFTTPHYTAHEVRLVNGVSDHMAVVADIERA